MNFLEEIIESKKKEIERLAGSSDLERLRSAASSAPPPRDFAVLY